ncbi:hypothetical protein [Streptomyces mirabilis]|uniref:hypothetical protein n=1 Tax=Streptomyces mirabilis TaxID=68239 RepID=UPI0033E74E33
MAELSEYTGNSCVNDSPGTGACASPTLGDHHAQSVDQCHEVVTRYPLHQHATGNDADAQAGDGIVGFISHVEAREVQDAPDLFNELDRDRWHASFLHHSNLVQLRSTTS